MTAPHRAATAPSTEPPPAAVILQLATAYHASRALQVAVALGLAERLAAGPRSVEALATATGTHAPSLLRLLRALAAFGVFHEDEEDGRYSTAPPGELLRADATGSMRALVLMFGHPDFRQTWDALEHCVRTGETAAKHLFDSDDVFARYAADPSFGPLFNAGMTALSASVATALVAAYDFSGASFVVDVGGGHGRLLAEVLRAAPGARGILLDLPSVVAGAAPLLAAAGVADRCETMGGDMFAAVPAGADLYVLKNVVIDWDDLRATAILANCRRAMGKGAARLLLVERVMMDRVEVTPVAQAHALGDLNMLVRTGGRERTAAEFRRLLGAAGLRLTRIIPTRTDFSVVEGVAA